MVAGDDTVDDGARRHYTGHTASHGNEDAEQPRARERGETGGQASHAHRGDDGGDGEVGG